MTVAVDWRWWQDPQAVWRHTRDLLSSTLQTLRPELDAATLRHALRDSDAAQTLHLSRDLGVGSLELLSLGAAFIEASGMHRPEHLERLHGSLLLGDWVTLAGQAWQAGADAPQPAVRFRTSGSTGRPRSCVHPWPWLTQEAQALARHLQAGGPATRVVSVVRSHHIYGHLFTLLLPRALGCPVVDAVAQAPAAVLAGLQAGDVVVGFPDWWRAAVQSGLALPPGVTGVSSTAPCPPELALATLDAGLCRLVLVYGSTETAGIAWQEAGDDAYALMPHWRRPADPKDSASLVRLTPNGQTATVALPDQVRWLDDTHLVPAGRLDLAVQVGGVNVSPQAVRQHFLSLPEVADASVRLHDFGGVPRLKLFVVPSAEGARADGLLATLRSHGLGLQPAARPAHIALGPALPVNAIGKACDWPVPDTPG
ncbi:MAG: hypothetical protein RI907_2697 [Pseudomonadota bacterium]|jgi:4-coumarate--CoA ligase (photoactive yellow protein activation family)